MNRSALTLFLSGLADRGVRVSLKDQTLHLEGATERLTARDKFTLNQQRAQLLEFLAPYQPADLGDDAAQFGTLPEGKYTFLASDQDKTYINDVGDFFPEWRDKEAR